MNLDDIAGSALQKVGYTGPKQEASNETYTGQDVVNWIQSEFYIPETKGPMQLWPYQIAMLLEAHRRDENGKFIYDLILWSDIKKSIKSCIAAGVTLFRALHLYWGSCKIVANDFDQAQSRVFFYAQRALELNPRLKDRGSSKVNKITLDTRSTIQAVPIDPTGEAGANDDFIEFTELHGAKSTAQVRMWTEMTIPPNKHGYAQRWIDTYAGYSGEAPILEPLFHRLVKPQNKLRLPGAEDVPVYADGRTLCLWNTSPRLPWQTKEYYESERQILLPDEFDRIHLNRWVSSTSIFVQPAWWAACRVEKLPPLDKFREIVIALDAAVSGDCFGIVAAYRIKDSVIPFYARKWDPPKGGKIDYTDPAGNKEDTDYPEGELRRLIKIYNVIAVGYDPYQLHSFCTALENENLAYFETFSQQGSRLKADKQLQDMIKGRKMIHDGNPDLTAHVTNANAKIESGRLRIVHRTAALKIDLCVCTSMVTALALDYLPE